MLGSLSLLPSLAVAGVTTSVSLATAMGGVQSLPQEPARPPVVRVAMAEPTVAATTAARPLVPQAELPTDAPAPDPTEAPAATPAPTDAPAVVAPPPVPPKATAPAPAPAPVAPAPKCATFPYNGFTVTWCAPTSPGAPSTWTATNGTSTYHGVYSGPYTGVAPSGSSPWDGATGGNHDQSHAHH
ncbi:MAG TPA: hypothetical protein VN193_01370 [Candidatus Angelobacter sp.]|nr:hypothetical protein [Candidatus Angelobacter sp.]